MDNQRGRGAWLDEGRHIYHHGQELTVDGVKTDVTRIRSNYIYQLGPKLPKPVDTPLTNEEGLRLLELASRFRWIQPGSAALLAGWVALAPLCGALKWRPHIWVTGNSGSGKSTLLEKFIHPLVDGMVLYSQGNSSEAGIRQELKSDAIPVLVDENEMEDDRDISRVQAILTLMRQASTESQAKTYKGTVGGTAQHFHIRSMFCLCSIQVGIKRQSDVERVAVLALKPSAKTEESITAWAKLSDDIARTIGLDETIHQRLFKRSLDNLRTTIMNIHLFTHEAAKFFKNQRAGDQYGGLLAGAYGLLSTKEATAEDAQYFLSRWDWSHHVEESDNDEGKRALQGLLGALIRGKSSDFTVFEILSAAIGQSSRGADMEADTAGALLQRYGMKADNDFLYLSNQSSELRELMSKSTFAVDWRGVLLRVPGIDRNENRPVRLNGASVKVTRIPLDLIYEPDQRHKPVRPVMEPEIPF